MNRAAGRHWCCRLGWMGDASGGYCTSRVNCIRLAVWTPGTRTLASFSIRTPSGVGAGVPDGVPVAGVRVGVGVKVIVGVGAAPKPTPRKESYRSQRLRVYHPPAATATITSATPLATAA